jgi:predicted ATPase
MITRFRVENYKALRDVSLDLTPIHVLIGPNDSGKTSILEAITALGRLVVLQPLEDAFQGRWQGRELVWRGATGNRVPVSVILAEGEHRIEYRIVCEFAETDHRVMSVGEEVQTTESAQARIELSGQNRNSALSQLSNNPRDPNHKIAKRIRDALAGTQSYKWIPSHLALPVAFEFATTFGMEVSGFGLAMCLNDILTDDHEKYGYLEKRFRDFFPYISRIRLRREQGFLTGAASSPQSPGLGMYFDLTDGDVVLPASQASDGLLLVLAYLAILYSPQPPRLLLIEEPENGIHPRRLGDVLDILKELVHGQDRTQVLLTTHSPYVVDRFQPEEVTLCLRGSDGAVTAHRLSESKTVREQMDIFPLGEIWTAEGDEALATQASRD